MTRGDCGGPAQPSPAQLSPAQSSSVQPSSPPTEKEHGWVGCCADPPICSFGRWADLSVPPLSPSCPPHDRPLPEAWSPRRCLFLTLPSSQTPSPTPLRQLLRKPGCQSSPVPTMETWHTSCARQTIYVIGPGPCQGRIGTRLFCWAQDARLRSHLWDMSRLLCSAPHDDDDADDGHANDGKSGTRQEVVRSPVPVRLFGPGWAYIR